MIPAWVTKALGVTIQALDDSAPIRDYLLDALSAAVARAAGVARAVYFQFRNAYIRQGGTDAGASEAYHLALAWRDLPQILSELPTDQPIDPRLARPIRGTSGYESEVEYYRFTVRVTGTDPLTGDTIIRNVYIPGDKFMTPGELFDLATPIWASIVEGSPRLDETPNVSGWTLSAELIDFARYT